MMHRPGQFYSSLYQSLSMNTHRKLTLEELKEKREAIIRNLRTGNTKPVEVNEDKNEGTVHVHVTCSV